MTNREAILSALSAALGCERNPPMKDFKDSYIALRDGDIELIEEFLNGNVYEFTATPTVIIGVEGGDTADRDAALAALIETTVQTLEGLGTSLAAAGLIENLRPQAPDFQANDLWGAVGVKVADLPIQIDYWSDSSVG